MSLNFNQIQGQLTLQQLPPTNTFQVFYSDQTGQMQKGKIISNLFLDNEIDISKLKIPSGQQNKILQTNSSNILEFSLLNGQNIQNNSLDIVLKGQINSNLPSSGQYKVLVQDQNGNIQNISLDQIFNVSPRLFDVNKLANLQNGIMHVQNSILQFSQFLPTLYIQDQSITNSKILSLDFSKITNFQLQTSAILDNTLNISKLNTDSQTDQLLTVNDLGVSQYQKLSNRLITNNTISGLKLQDQTVSLQKLSTVTQNSIVLSNSLGVLQASQTLPGSFITNNSISGNQIALQTITNSNISNTANISLSKINFGITQQNNYFLKDNLQFEQIQFQNLSGQIINTQIPANTITIDKLQDSEIPYQFICTNEFGTIGYQQYLQNDFIQNNTITGQKILDNTISGLKLLDNSINQSKLIGDIPFSKIDGLQDKFTILMSNKGPYKVYNFDDQGNYSFSKISFQHIQELENISNNTAIKKLYYIQNNVSYLTDNTTNDDQQFLNGSLQFSSLPSDSSKIDKINNTSGFKQILFSNNTGTYQQTNKTNNNTDFFLNADMSFTQIKQYFFESSGNLNLIFNGNTFLRVNSLFQPIFFNQTQFLNQILLQNVFINNNIIQIGNLNSNTQILIRNRANQNLHIYNETNQQSNTDLQILDNKQLQLFNNSSLQVSHYGNIQSFQSTMNIQHQNTVLQTINNQQVNNFINQIAINKGFITNNQTINQLVLQNDYLTSQNNTILRLQYNQTDRILLSQTGIQVLNNAVTSTKTSFNNTEFTTKQFNDQQYIQKLNNTSLVKQILFLDEANNIQMTNKLSNNTQLFLNANMEFSDISSDKITTLPTSLTLYNRILINQTNIQITGSMLFQQGFIGQLSSIRNDQLQILNENGNTIYQQLDNTKITNYKPLDMNNNQILNCPNIEDKITKITNTSGFKQVQFINENNQYQLTTKTNDNTLNFLNANMQFSNPFQTHINLNTNQVNFTPISAIRLQIADTSSRFFHFINMNGNSITNIRELRAQSATFNNILKIQSQDGTNTYFQFEPTINKCFKQLDMNNNTIINANLISTSQTSFSDNNLITKQFADSQYVKLNTSSSTNQQISGTLSIQGSTDFNRLTYAYYSLSNDQQQTNTGIVSSVNHPNPLANYSLTTEYRIRVPEINTTSSKYIKRKAFLEDEKQKEQIEQKIEEYIDSINPQYYNYKYRKEQSLQKNQLGVFAEEIQQSLVVQNSEFISNIQLQIHKYNQNQYYISEKELLTILELDTIQNTGIIFIDTINQTELYIKSKQLIGQQICYILQSEQQIQKTIQTIDKIEIVCKGIDQIQLNYANTCAIKHLSNKINQIFDILSKMK